MVEDVLEPAGTSQAVVTEQSPDKNAFTSWLLKKD